MAPTTQATVSNAAQSRADNTAAPRRLDIFSPGFGLAMVGAGLMALAAVEGTSMLLGRATDTTTAQAGVGEWIVSDAPMPAFGAHQPAPEHFEAAAMLDPQSAVGTGPGAPRSTSRNAAPPASGVLVGIAANPIPNGTAVYRLWSSGRVEAMITTEENVWSQWVPAAPGLSTNMQRPLSNSDNPDTNP
jgi:hypothetical protein